jgi:hypothetical protein
VELDLGLQNQLNHASETIGIYYRNLVLLVEYDRGEESGVLEYSDVELEPRATTYYSIPQIY